LFKAGTGFVGKGFGLWAGLKPFRIIILPALDKILKTLKIEGRLK
jgi:hypothetical protein